MKENRKTGKQENRKTNSKRSLTQWFIQTKNS
jgi:hypothetical protein